MKNLMFITVLSIASCLQACAQKTNKEKTPDKVLSAFNEKFPEAKKVKWEKEDEAEWEAEFKLNNQEYSANFSSNGEWMETEYEIKESEIPANIRSILDENFTDYEIEEVEIAETAGGKSYEMEIEVGEEEFEVTIDSKGILTKKTESEENDENDED